MSAEVYHVIRCDQHTNGERCHEEWGHPGYVANHTDLRRHLKEHGWRRTRDGRDLCPDHANQ